MGIICSITALVGIGLTDAKIRGRGQIPFTPPCVGPRFLRPCELNTEWNIWWNLIPMHMNYGRPIKPFFIEIPNFWPWAGNLGLGQINFGAFVVFLNDLLASILVLWVPCPCFLLMDHYFKKTLKAFIFKSQIYKWDWDLNPNPQRIRDRAYASWKLNKDA